MNLDQHSICHHKTVIIKLLFICFVYEGPSFANEKVIKQRHCHARDVKLVLFSISISQ